MAHFAMAHGLRGEDLKKAIEPLVAWPAAVGFLLALGTTIWLAKKDGLSLRALGWSRPGGMDVAIGLVAACVLAAGNAYVFFPLVEAAEPPFDPTLAALGWPAAVLMTSTAVVAEETLFRGYALRVLQERHGRVAAVLIPYVVYALVAPAPGLAVKLWAFGLGLALAGLVLWRKSLWPAAIAHLLLALFPKLLGAPD